MSHSERTKNWNAFSTIDKTEFICPHLFEIEIAYSYLKTCLNAKKGKKILYENIKILYLDIKYYI